MATYNAESAITRIITPRYSRAGAASVRPTVSGAGRSTLVALLSAVVGLRELGVALAEHVAA